MFRSALRGAQVALVGLALVGCSATAGSRYAYFLAPGHEGAPGAQRWLVAPANFASTVPEHLSSGADRLSAELVQYLSAAGRQVSAISMRQILDQFEEVLRERTEAGQDTSAQARDELYSQLTQRLARTVDFDVVVYPALTTRTARYHGDTAFWDGVGRRARFIRHKPGFQGRDTPDDDDVALLR